MRQHWIRTSILVTAFFAAVLAGYFVSSSVGQEALRQELEAQLTRLLRSPVEIERARILVSLSGGVQIEGHHLATYRDSDGAQLSSKRALVRLNVTSLALGKLRLRRLLLDGAEMRIERPERGEWTPLPLTNLTRARPDARDPNLEDRVRALRAFEGVARFFLEWGLLARQVELRDSSIVLLDSRVAPDGPPLKLRLDDIDGTLVESWISGQTELALRAQWLDSDGTLTPFELEGRRSADGSLHLAISTTDFDLNQLLPYATAAFPQARLAGTLSGVVTIDTPARDHTRIELDCVVYALDAAFRVTGDPVPYQSDRAHLQSQIELHPGRLRLSDGSLMLGELELEASGWVDRPIRESSDAQLKFTLSGAGIEELTSFVGALPQSDRAVLEPFISRIAEGEIAEIGGAGSTTLSNWRRILAGDLAKLPGSFLLEAEVKDVVVGRESEDRLTEMGGRIEWRSDYVRVRNAHALWNGHPLPTLNASINGMNHLLASSSSERELQRNASPLDGLRLAWEMLSGGGDSSDSSASPDVTLTIDELHHPTMRWPIRDATVRLSAREGGIGLELEQARWAEARVSGAGTWLWEPSPRFDVELDIEPRLATGNAGSDLDVESTPRASDLPPDVWMAGGLEMFSAPRTEADDDRSGAGSLAYAKLQSEFLLRGSTLEISSLKSQLRPRGELTAVGRLDLGHADSLPIDLQFQIENGDAAALTETVGFPADFVRGKAEVEGKLAWTARAGEPLFSRLSGEVAVVAVDGKIRRSLPVVTAVANLSEGLVGGSAVNFERVETVLEFEHGRMSTEQFALDGPMRLIAEGSFDPFKTEDAIDVTVGVFLMRQLDQVLGKLPLVKSLTDSNKGLFGVYFSLEGTWSDPVVTALPMKTLAEGNLLSQIIGAPLRMLQELESIFGGSGRVKDDGRAPSPLGRKGMRRPDKHDPPETVDGDEAALQQPAEAAP